MSGAQGAISGPADGPRACRPEELAQVIGLVDAAMRQGSDQTMLTDYPLVYAAANRDNVQVIAVDGAVRSVVPVLPKRATGDGFGFGLGIISPTATDPAYQHRGLGLANVNACVGRMTELGLELGVLWTMVATFPFYEHAGFGAVARYGGSRRLGRGDAARLRAWSGETVELGSDPGRLAEVVALHDQVPARIERSASQAAALLSLPKMTTLVALRDGLVAGYLVVSRASNKPGLLEAGGDSRAVEGLIRSALERLGADETIDLQQGFAPSVLDAVADQALAAVPLAPYTANMMVRLNDPIGYLRSIRPWLAQLGTSIADAVSIDVTDADLTISIEPRPFGMAIGTRRLDRHVTLTRRELTSILFGGHPDRPVTVPPELEWVPPLHLPIAVLDRS